MHRTVLSHLQRDCPISYCKTLNEGKGQAIQAQEHGRVTAGQTGGSELETSKAEGWEGTTFSCHLWQRLDIVSPLTMALLRMCLGVRAALSQMVFPLLSQHFPSTSRDKMGLDLSLLTLPRSRPSLMPALLICIASTALVSL